VASTTAASRLNQAKLRNIAIPISHRMGRS
jgi:hypothetical protein